MVVSKHSMCFLSFRRRCITLHISHKLLFFGWKHYVRSMIKLPTRATEFMDSTELVVAFLPLEQKVC